jgi:hypothetical protein
VSILRAKAGVRASKVVARKLRSELSSGRALVKVILENAYRNDDEVRGSKLTEAAGG